MDQFEQWALVNAADQPATVVSAIEMFLDFRRDAVASPVGDKFNLWLNGRWMPEMRRDEYVTHVEARIQELLGRQFVGRN